MSQAPGNDAPDFVRQTNLAQPRLGAEVISATDDFFAPKHRLIDPAPPIFIPDKFDEHGKWMDGWESRRKRVSGHDHCVVKLCPGVIHGFEVDTAFFTGNFPPHASIEACYSASDDETGMDWHELVPKMPLNGDSQHFVAVNDDRTWTHLRLHIYPDGGIARLRVYGEVHFDWSVLPKAGWLDLTAMQRGGRALACNDMHYGHMSNLIAPGHGLNMGDGWETRRRREPGNDWVILKLGHSGRIRQVEVDTAFFKGNYPARCSLHAALLEDLPDKDLSADGDYWKPLLEPVELGPDQMHAFETEVIDTGPVSHVRLDIYPDGGVSRLRLMGEWYES